MTNRQMIMLKLIQISDEEFAEFMDNEITVLMEGGLCLSNLHGKAWRSVSYGLRRMECMHV